MISIIARGIVVALAFGIAWKRRGQEESRIYAGLGVLFSVNFAGEVLEWWIK